MAEYTYADIIMDPNDPRLEGAIGKECYVSDFPKIALNNARDNLITDRLKRIEKEETCPFVDEEEEDNDNARLGPDHEARNNSCNDPSRKIHGTV